MQKFTGHICLTFLRCIFSNVSSMRLGAEQAESHWLNLFDFSPLWFFKCVLKLSPCGPRSLWKKQLAELIFKKIKSLELVKRPLWSDPESSFFNPETKFLVRWHNYGCGQLAQLKLSQLLQQYTVKSLFRSVKFLFLPALFWVAFFCKFSNQDFSLFHNGIITLHCLGRWQIYRRGYFSFQNSSTTKNDSTVSIFSELTPQKSRFC